jgi:DNA-binding MarR family transcriptional regulator
MPSRTSPPTQSLPTALSQALIAFTIEFDNEFEHRVEHHTGNKAGRGVWLTSMVMWSNFMRLIPAGGVPLAAVKANGRITNLGGLQRWGYISVDPVDQTVHPKPDGKRAQDVWRPLAAEIEGRWRERFGDAAIDELREALSSVTDPALPLHMPVLGYADGMQAGHVRGAPGAVAEDLAAMLSQALLSFTLEYEEESALSLALSTNVVRVLRAEGVPIRDLPTRSGVSKEAITAAVGFLQRNGYAAVEPDPAGRSKLVTLTDKGLAAQTQHARLAKAVERRWRKRLGGDFDRLAKALITGRQLALGLQPYPDGWRAGRNPYRAQTQAVLADPASALPQYPMVLHRGGYPDGS